MFLIITFLFLCTRPGAQTDIPKVCTEIKKLSGEYLSSFKNIKGAVKYEDEFEIIYYSRLKLTGSADSTNLIRFVKDKEQWSYIADYYKENITAEVLDSLIREIVFSFGKIKLTENSFLFGRTYVPDDKKAAQDKIRSFYLRVYDRKNAPHDDTGGRISFTLGANADLWHK